MDDTKVELVMWLKPQAAKPTWGVRREGELGREASGGLEAFRGGLGK